MRLLKVVLLFALLATFGLSQVSEQKVVGRWAATISPVNKAGEKQFDANFQFVVERSGSGLKAALYNGPERMDFTGAQFTGGELQLFLAHYDGVITAKLDDKGELEGDYTRQTSTGVRHYPLHARMMNDAGAAAPKKSVATGAPSLGGDWVVTFPNDTGTDKVAPAVFHEDATSGTVNGTIAPVSGDFGLMSGKLTSGNGGLPSFSLSRFDGIHVLLMEGQFDSADSLHGALNKSDKFTAVRKIPSVETKTAEATPPDAEAITKVKDPAEVFHYKGIDPHTGKTVTEEDFKGKPVIVDIFGTWCPNCHDEAPLLVDLYKRYHPDGLEIVGLSYEYTDDAKRNARLVDIYRKKFGIEFPLLVSGTTGGGDIAKTLPQLVGFGAYPTTIFIGRDGHVQKIHAGFAGPATGMLDEVKQRFDENVRELVKK